MDRAICERTDRRIHQFFCRHDTILRSIQRTEHMGSQRVGDTTVSKLAPDDRVRGSERQFAGPNGIASSASDNVCLAGTDNHRVRVLSMGL